MVLVYLMALLVRLVLQAARKAALKAAPLAPEHPKATPGSY